jgi:hypothetical protein
MDAPMLTRRLDSINRRIEVATRWLDTHTPHTVAWSQCYMDRRALCVDRILIEAELDALTYGPVPIRDE